MYWFVVSCYLDSLKSYYLSAVQDMIKERPNPVKAFFPKLALLLAIMLLIALVGNLAEWVLERMSQPLFGWLLL